MSSSGVCRMSNYDYQIYLEETLSEVDETTGQAKYSVDDNPDNAYVSLGEGLDHMGGLRADTRVEQHLKIWLRSGGTAVKVTRDGRQVPITGAPGELNDAKDVLVFGDSVVLDGQGGRVRVIKRNGDDMIAISPKISAEDGFERGRNTMADMEKIKINTTVRSIDKMYTQHWRQYTDAGAEYGASTTAVEEVGKGTKDYTITRRVTAKRRQSY